jgi:YD repeat-containing protein
MSTLEKGRARNSQNPTTYSWDNMDRLQTRTDPLGNVESFGYDGNDNVTCFTDRRGKATRFQYDGLNRLIFAGFGASSCSAANYERQNAFQEVIGVLARLAAPIGDRPVILFSSVDKYIDAPCVRALTRY